jgi:hypothetical protein
MAYADDKGSSSYQGIGRLGVLYGSHRKAAREQGSQWFKIKSKLD